MKKKTLKLNFNKSTVANLNPTEQNNIRGGVEKFTNNCDPSVPMYLSCIDKWCLTEWKCETDLICGSFPC
ncbi:MAG: class I lanthipeptide [Hyphomicrobiales bacterium]